MPLAYKAGVRVEKRTPALDHIENCALATQSDLGYPKVLVVTSINDSSHSTDPVSRHYTNEAEDLRTKGRASNDMGSPARKRAFRARFQALLGDRFWCSLKFLGTGNEHIHAQVKKGEVYP